jgi:hypothetical protein
MAILKAWSASVCLHLLLQIDESAGVHGDACILTYVRYGIFRDVQED